MRKVAMIEASDGEHSHEVKGDSDGDGGPTPVDPEDAKATEVKEEKGEAASPFEAIRARLHDLCAFGEVIRVEPLADGCEGALKSRSGSGLMAAGVHENKLKGVGSMNLVKTSRVGCGSWGVCVSGLGATDLEVGGL